MKIEIGKSYHVPTQELEDDFLKRAEEQGFLWRGGEKPSEFGDHITSQSTLCICTGKDKTIYFTPISSALSWSDAAVVEWEIEKPKQKKRFSIGDSAVIVANTNNHRFEMGENVRIVTSQIPLPNFKYYAESLKNGAHWYVADADIAPINNSTRQGKPTIIRLGNLKIVFNGDYTIVTDGRFTGKAKRNPADEYDAVVGLKLAVERYEKGKAPRRLTAKEIMDSMEVANWRK